MSKRVLHDEYFKKAKAEGYRSRAAYKLLQIQEHRRIIRKGARVLDLGCAPGSWLQVASQLVGPDGLVLGIDLTPVKGRIAGPVRTAVADVYEVDPADLVQAAGGKFDAVISDMGPSTTGHNDHFLSARLCDAVLAIAMHALKPTGNLTMKVLEGTDYPRLLDDMGELFMKSKGYKPRASRAVSREMFLIGQKFVGSPLQGEAMS